MPLKISALVLTYNEQDNIERCLSSLDFCAEIIVVDSGSDDNTVELAKKFTDKVYYHKMEGHGPQLNWGIEKCAFDWIFSLDADETVSVELKNNIINLKPVDLPAGFFINRRTQYLGRWILHCGWYPQHILRLFDKTKGRCNDAAIHKSIRVEGKTALLSGDIFHYSYRNLSHHLRKIDEYTDKMAIERYRNGRRFNLFKAIFAPSAEFLKKYFLKAGFLDGFPGFCVAMTSAHYTFLKQAKLYELQKSLIIGKSKSQKV